MFFGAFRRPPLLPCFGRPTESRSDSSLTKNSSHKLDIVRILWGSSLEGKNIDVDPDSFYSIYLHEVKKSSCGATFKSLTLETPDELRTLVQYLYDNRDRHLVDLQEYTKEVIQRCILIWLRIDLERRTDPDKGYLQDDFWPGDVSLRVALERLFPRRRTFQTTSDAKFLLTETTFTDTPTSSHSYKSSSSSQSNSTVYSVYPVSHWGKHNTAERLSDWGYFEIKWTNNLLDHLVLEEDESRLDEDNPPKIYLFHHASFLRTSTFALEMFPEGLIEETLDSLALFLQSSQPRIKKWFEKENKKIPTVDRWRGPLDRHLLCVNQWKLLRPLTRCSSSRRRIRPYLGRNLAHYQYWGERLSRIDQVFAEMRPTNRRQWWKDTRMQDYNQKVAFYAYGISILALLLTSIFGLLQIVFSRVS